MEIFAKVLSTPDVERRLSSSDACVAALPRSEGCHVIVLPVEDDAGISWSFGFKIIRGVVSRLHIVSGWTQFVRSKDLRTGDIVILYKDEGANYKIKVKKTDTSSSANRKRNLGSI